MSRARQWLFDGVWCNARRLASYWGISIDAARERANKSLQWQYKPRKGETEGST